MIQPIRSSKENGCPIDNIKLSPETDLFPDNYTRRQILGHKIPCPYSHLGCTANVYLSELNSHITECTFKILNSNTEPYQCLFKEVGCLSQFASRDELDEHMAQSINSHLKVYSSNFFYFRSLIMFLLVIIPGLQRTETETEPERKREIAGVVLLGPALEGNGSEYVGYERIGA